MLLPWGGAADICDGHEKSPLSLAGWLVAARDKTGWGDEDSSGWTASSQRFWVTGHMLGAGLTLESATGYGVLVAECRGVERDNIWAYIV